MTVHIVGAGLAGLACAVRLALQGRSIALYEADKAAGGRCRSLRTDPGGRQVETGLHLLVSHQRAAQAYLAETGGSETLAEAPEGGIRFVDLIDGARWRLRPATGPIPWWTLVPGRAVPGTGLRDWLAMFRIRFAGRRATVADCLPTGSPSRRRLWEPSVVAALNTTADRGSARAYWSGIRGSLFAGADAARVRYARDGLTATFVSPALTVLADRGALVRFGARLEGLAVDDGRVAGLDFATGRVAVGPGDQVVLAVPPAEGARLVGDLTVPGGDSGIVTLAYFVAPPRRAIDAEPLFALIGDRTEWVQLRHDRVIVTIGAADGLLDGDRNRLARTVWRDLSEALSLAPEPLPEWHMLAFAHGTFSQTPENEGRRPGPRTGLANLWLAGDWTATGYPASVESAVRSGHTAARLAGRAESGGSS